MLAIINDAARAYQGVIPADRWHEPYMSADELESEIAAGVAFWVVELEGRVSGVMGIQDKGDVALVRHAYVAPGTQRAGLGTRLLQHVQGLVDKPVLIGTWATASWAIDFYRRNGFTVVTNSEKDRLLRTYWSIPDRQIETSVVLADGRTPHLDRVAMPPPVHISPIQQHDFSAWAPLWDGYNAFYGRSEATALPPQITEATWRRFFDPAEPVFALVAESQGKLVGLVHYLFHRSTTSLELTCYLQDLFTAPAERGRGIGKALIEGVYQQARGAGLSEVYWQTHVSNAAGRLPYDKVATHAGFIVYSRDV